MFGSVRAVRSAPLRFVVRQFFDLPFKLPVECAVGVEENGGGAEPENFGDEYDGDSGEREGESQKRQKPSVPAAMIRATVTNAITGDRLRGR